MIRPQQVLFLHGFMGSAMNWSPCRTLLEKKLLERGLSLKTHAIDLLGHAQNHANANYTGSAHEAMTLDLEKQMSSQGSAIVVAHSFALRPALLLGKKNPELIPYLIVEDSSPQLSQVGYDFLTGVLAAPTPFSGRGEAKDYFDSKYGLQSPLSRFFLSNIRNGVGSTQADWRFDKAFLLKLLSEALGHDLWDTWQSYAGKLHFIYGEKSPAINPELITKMTSLRQGLEVTCIEDAGHWIHAEKPEAFADCLIKIIENFLD